MPCSQGFNRCYFVVNNHIFSVGIYDFRYTKYKFIDIFQARITWQLDSSDSVYDTGNK